MSRHEIRTKATLSCLVAMLCPFVWVPIASAQEIPEIVATINLSKTDTQAVDQFYAALSKAGRHPFYLKLKIEPDQTAAGPGYALTRDLAFSGASTGVPANAANGANVCGNGNWGTIDNFATVFRLGFKPYQDTHSGVEITIGDRVRYPYHNMICTIEDYTSAQRTPLLVEGHFVVSIANIPTAIIYTLFPINPHSTQ